jgi:hypothetical protein
MGRGKISTAPVTISNANKLGNGNGASKPLAAEQVAGD